MLQPTVAIFKEMVIKGKNTIFIQMQDKFFLLTFSA